MRVRHQHQTSTAQRPSRPVARSHSHPEGMLELQRAVGNRVIQRTLIEPRSAPVWGPEDALLGGSSMFAIIGAEQGQGDFGLPTAGSVPAADTPAIIKNVGKAGGLRYIAGHLLNNVLGGPGVNNNLTVLSKDANSDHSGKELKLKHIGERASLLDRQSAAAARMSGSAKYFHGAKYTVTVNAPAPNLTAIYGAERRLAKSITLKTEPVKQKENDNQLEAWTDPQVNQWANEATTTIKNVPPYPDSVGPFDLHANKYHKQLIGKLTPQKRALLHTFGIVLGANPTALPTGNTQKLIKKINKQAKNMAMTPKKGVRKSHKTHGALSSTKLVTASGGGQVTSSRGRKSKRFTYDQLKELGLI